jgi:hypothetical protein
MKNSIKSIITLFCVTTLFLSCKDNVLEEMEFVPGRKSLEKTSEYYENGKLKTSTFAEYDKYNNVTKSVEVSHQKKPTFTTSLYKNTYDSNNNLVKVSGGFEETVYQYYPDNKIKRVERSFTGTNLSSYIREYDEKGQEVRFYIANYEIVSEPFDPIKYGRLTSFRENLKSYNADGKELRSYWTKDNKFDSSYEYEYSKDNLVTKYTSKNTTSTSVRTYKYDDKKRLIEENEGNSKTIHSYDSQGLETGSITYVDGKVERRNNYEYDSQKRIIKSTSTNSDGLPYWGWNNDNINYYSNGSIKSFETFFLKKDSRTELYKGGHTDYDIYGNLLDRIEYNEDCTQKLRYRYTYLYQ